MAAADGVDDLIERFRLALDEFVKGNPEPCKELFSHGDDVSLANPFGPPARGWEQVAATMDRAGSSLREGGMVAFEEIAKHVTPELAYTVWLERQKAKIGARQNVTHFTLRVTMIYRPEEGTWKVVHRHADPITGPRPPESVIQE